MEVEKRSSKGGFLQLFDWNLKSRKKLFSNKLEQSENLKQVKENVDGSAISRLQQVHEIGRGPGDRVNSDLHYHGASLVSGDEGCASKAPGVVARLMGLDSLPTSNVAEPDNAISFESQSFRDSYDFYQHPTSFSNEHHIVIYESMRNKLDGMARTPLDLKLQKMQRPFERFQTEVLPPKSAKPISITHSRLLSPVKSPGLIPPKNAAYIMEAAAKIIEQSPRTSVKGKLPSLGSSSVPLRIQDLKEKMEATRRSSRILETSNKQNPSKHMKRRPSEKGDMHLFKTAEASKVGPQSQKNKEKSVSLAVQTKSNTLKKDALASMGKRSVNQNEHSETKPSFVSKQQSNTRKSAQNKTSSGRSSDVLRQNNQKQNSVSSKDKDSPKSSISNQKERKVQPKSDVTRGNKVVNKVVVNTSAGTGKVNSVSIDSRKDSSKCGVKKSSAKKRTVSMENNFVKTAANNVVTSKDKHTVNRDIPVEGSTKWDAVDWKNGQDVVSFTFTSPIKRSLPRSSSSTQAMEKNKSSCPISPGNDDTLSTNSAASSSGFHVVGSDALSILLEQKLKELTSRVEISHEDEVGGHSLSPSENSFQDSTCTLNSMSTTSAYTKGLQFDLFRDNPVVGCNLGFSIVDEVALRATESGKGPEEMRERSNNECEMEFDIRYSSPVSSLEPSRSDASCNSLETNRSCSSEVSDSKWRASMEADEVSDWSSGRTPQLMHGDLDLADSASSSSVRAMRRADGTTTLTSTYFEGLYHWELEYIRSIITNADLMFEEFALGQVHKIMDPNLFDLLESHITESNKNLEEPFKIARKALFDCVEECLEFRCKHVFCGSFKDWGKSVAVFQSTDYLVESLYREILSLTNMADLMVDEVVDRDMSTQTGKWVEFDTDTFEEGIDIEKEILTSLVDELVDEFLL